MSVELIQLGKGFEAGIYQPDRDIYVQPKLVEMTPFGKIVAVERDGLFNPGGVISTDRRYPQTVKVVIETPPDNGSAEILAGTRVTPFLQAGAADTIIGSEPSYHMPESTERITGEDGELLGFRYTYRMFMTFPDGETIRVKE